FLNVHAALDALPRVVEIMAEELNWDEDRQDKETENAKQFLTTMGLPVSPIAYPVNIPDVVVGPPVADLEKPEQKSFWDRLGGKSPSGSSVSDSFYSRAQFNPEELAEFHKVFGELDYNG